MANPEHVKIVKRGAEAMRPWREKNPGVRFDLRRACLRAEDLSRANFSGADLAGADLSSAQLHGASLVEVDLRHADLSGADLGTADLRSADLGEANLSGANLIGADLRNAKLSGATLSECRIGLTVLGNVDLSRVEALSTVRHLAPSTVGVDTLYRSQGSVPATFLRGCGVPDDLIAYLPSLLDSKQTVLFYSCFISHSHKDQEFCERLHSRMRDAGLRVWFSPEDIKSGRKLHEQIDQAIRVYDKLLLVLSEQSMASEWVATEIYHARQREVTEGKRVLFPIRLVDFDKIREWRCFNADTGKDMAREIREYFVPDFSNWKNHDAFEAAFGRLLDDLKAEADRNRVSDRGSEL